MTPCGMVLGANGGTFRPATNDVVQNRHAVQACRTGEPTLYNDDRPQGESGMNADTGVVWVRVVCALLLPILTACAESDSRQWLGNHPWPLDSTGQPAVGTTKVLVLVNYHGLPVEACINSSSGNYALDEEAIRRVARLTFAPYMKQGWPITSYARVPIAFGHGTHEPPTTTEGQHATWICQTEPLVGASTAEQALAHDTELTIVPTREGLVPGSDNAWPLDAHGKPVKLDAYEDVLVDASGHIVKFGPLSPKEVDEYGLVMTNRAPASVNFKGFTQAASAKLAKVSFAVSDEEHWQTVKFHFGY